MTKEEWNRQERSFRRLLRLLLVGIILFISWYLSEALAVMELLAPQ